MTALRALRIFGLNRELSHRAVCRRLHTEAVEETIPVPWGIIAGKRWGKSTVQPILALHGLFDNAASFDKIIPLLEINQPILAIDIPGFGKSSNPPQGLSPNFFETLTWLRYLIKNTLRWKKVTLLAHSFGSNLAFNYAGLFPNEVDKFISIECARINMASKADHLLADFRKAYEGGTLNLLPAPKEGTYETFLSYMIESREKANLHLEKELCEIILQRELEKLGENHYKSNVDRRIYLKYVSRPTLPFLEALSNNIKCEVLMIRATEGIINEKRLKLYEDHLNNIRKNSSNVLSKLVKGRHHVHMENPKEVANIISEFLNES